MTKLPKFNAEQKEIIKSLGLAKVKDLDELRDKVIDFLQENEVEDVEEEGIAELLDFASAFIEEDDDIEEVEEDDEDDEEDTYDALADEVEEDEVVDYQKLTVKQLRAMIVEEDLMSQSEANKIRKKAELIEILENSEIDEEDEEDDEELDYNSMKVTELRAIIVEDNLLTKAQANKIRKKAELIEILENGVDEEVEEIKPEPKKQQKTAVVRKSTNGMEKFDARNNEDHEELINEFLEQYFKPEEYEFKILKQGVTVRGLFKNAKPTIINFDELKVDQDNDLIGNIYFNKFKSVEDLMEFLPEAWHDRKIGMFRGETHPCIKQVTEQELDELFTQTEILSESIERAGQEDGKLGSNREKLEKTLKESKKTNSSKVKNKRRK